MNKYIINGLIVISLLFTLVPYSILNNHLRKECYTALYNRHGGHGEIWGMSYKTTYTENDLEKRARSEISCLGLSSEEVDINKSYILGKFARNKGKEFMRGFKDAK